MINSAPSKVVHRNRMNAWRAWGSEFHPEYVICLVQRIWARLHDHGSFISLFTIEQLRLLRLPVAEFLECYLADWYIVDLDSGIEFKLGDIVACRIGYVVIGQALGSRRARRWLG